MSGPRASASVSDVAFGIALLIATGAFGFHQLAQIGRPLATPTQPADVPVGAPVENAPADVPVALTVQNVAEVDPEPEGDDFEWEDFFPVPKVMTSALPSP